MVTQPSESPDLVASAELEDANGILTRLDWLAMLVVLSMGNAESCRSREPPVEIHC